MKKIEMTMHVIEDRNAPLLLTEKNLPGACCCSCCCCANIGSGTGGSAVLPQLEPADLQVIPLAKF